jgi:hypothetical protein
MASTTDLNPERLMKAIQDELEIMAGEIREHLIKEAVEKFERQLRVSVGGAAFNVAKYVDMETTAYGTMIRVRLVP